jgi:hypothetical protein
VMRRATDPPIDAVASHRRVLAGFARFNKPPTVNSTHSPSRARQILFMRFRLSPRASASDHCSPRGARASLFGGPQMELN